MIIAPSILNADFLRLHEQLELVNGFADQIHLDIMDGHFVPNISFGPMVVEAVKRGTKLPLDVHLMIDNASCYIDAFVKAGASSISVHAEKEVHLMRIIDQIKSYGIKASVALNPATNEEFLRYVINEIDSVLVMSVNPGFGGQQFIPSALVKIANIKAMIDKSSNKDCLIAVDGGVNDQNISALYNAGARIFVLGSYLFSAKEPKEAFFRLKDAMASVRKG